MLTLAAWKAKTYAPDIDRIFSKAKIPFTRLCAAYALRDLGHNVEKQNRRIGEILGEDPKTIAKINEIIHNQEALLDEKGEDDDDE